MRSRRLLVVALLAACGTRLPAPPWAAAPRRPIPRNTARGLRGLADYHAHMFSELGFGGYLFAGRAFVPKPEPEATGKALAPCAHTSPRYPVTAIASMAVGDGPHGHDGYPQFATWPRAETHTHQQMYLDWLYRSYRYGLRLVVVTATSSETLCNLTHNTRSCDDMDVVRAYVTAVREMEAWVAQHEGRWLEVATSSADAERIIRDNRLAVVLGMEVDTPFGCSIHDGPICAAPGMARALDQYVGMGIRQITPIHLVDDGFGGSALYDERLSVNHYYLRGYYQNVRDCSAEDVSWRLRGARSVWWSGPLTFAHKARWYAPRVPAGTGHCNRLGLTRLGEILVNAMMRRGLLIDLEHMSELSAGATIDLARARRYPLMLSHSWFRDVKLTKAALATHGRLVERHWNEQRSEMHHRADTLAAIRELGGVVGVVTNQGYVMAPEQSPVANDCDTSSKSVAQALVYAVGAMHGVGVGLGTDVNGFNGQPTGRFGVDGCGGGYAARDVREAQLAVQKNPVRYDGSQSVDRVPLVLSRTGNRVFDFNTMGLAHYGLLPDLISDLDNVGVPEDTIEVLFHSAEDYVRMWARAEAQAKRITETDEEDSHDVR